MHASDIRVLVPCLLLAVASAWAPATSRGQDWPQWRGPDGQGHASAHDLPSTWDEQRNVVWKREVPGRGWSSPVVGQGLIWVTTAVEVPPTAEELEAVRSRPNGSTLEVSGRVTMRAIAVDWQDGHVVHDLELFEEDDPQAIHSLNSYASPSPVLDGDRLYCHFGAHGTACIDTSVGEVVWRTDDIAINHENGPGSTPVLWHDLLIVHCDGTDDQYVVAYDTATGERRWTTRRSGEMNDEPQFKKAYGTPLVVAIEGREQIVSPGADWLYGYDPATGDESWKVSYGVLGFSIVPRPVYGHGMIYMSTSFMQPELLAIRVEGVSEPRIEWRHSRQAPRMPSPLLVGDELYLVSDSGIMTCLDARTGQPHWNERLGGDFCSSPILADGRIYVGNRAGEVFVIAPGTSFELLATNTVDDDVMATIVAVDDSLIVRTRSSLYRIAGKDDPEAGPRP